MPDLPAPIGSDTYPSQIRSRLWTSPRAASGRIRDDSGMHLQLTVVDPFGTATPASVEVAAAPGTPLGAVRDGAARSAVGRRDRRAVRRRPTAGRRQPARRAAAARRRGPDRRPRRPAASPAACSSCTCWPGPTPATCTTWRPGEHGIGRAVEARVRVDDPDVSRLHAVLRVATDGSGGTTVHDLGSTNGTTVDGDAGDRGTAGRCCPGQVLRVGDTRLSLVRPEQVPVSCRPDGAGHLEVNRPPRHLSRPAPVRVTVPPEPPARERSRFPLDRGPAPAGRRRRPRGGHPQPDVPRRSCCSRR